jgi:hypothetical protein
MCEIDVLAQDIEAFLTSADSDNSFFTSIVNYYTDNDYDFPPDLFDQFLLVLEPRPDLLTPFIEIASDPDNALWIYNLVFVAESPSTDLPPLSPPDSPPEDLFVDPSSPSDLLCHSTLSVSDLKLWREWKISTFVSTFFVSPDVALIILEHFNWKDHSHTAFLDNRESLLRSLSVPGDPNDSLGLREISAPFNCPICFEDKPGYSLYCGHQFCRSCLVDHCKKSPVSQLSGFYCPDCSQSRIFFRDVALLCGDSYAERAESIFLYRALGEFGIYCKFPDCQMVVRPSAGDCFGSAECVCGTRICAKCRENPHGPCNCDQVRKWSETDLEKRKMYRRQLVWEVREKRLMSHRLDKENISSTRERLSNDIETQQKLFDIRFQNKTGNDFYRTVQEEAISQMLIEMKIYLGDFPGNPQIFFNLHNLQNDPAVERWIGSHNESKSVEFMTRSCPKCKVRGVRGGVCNHVRCWQCGEQFCWLCGKSTGEGRHQCEGFVKDAPSQDVESSDQDQSLLEISEDELNLEDLRLYPPPMDVEARWDFMRFKHYNLRFLVHKDSVEAEERRRKSFVLEDWCTVFTKVTSRSSAEKMLQEMWKVLDLARETVMWSYPFMYFFSSEEKLSEKFENDLGNLENANEALITFAAFDWRKGDYNRLASLQKQVRDCRETLICTAKRIAKIDEE